VGSQQIESAASSAAFKSGASIFADSTFRRLENDRFDESPKVLAASNLGKGDFKVTLAEG